MSEIEGGFCFRPGEFLPLISTDFPFSFSRRDISPGLTEILVYINLLDQMFLTRVFKSRIFIELNEGVIECLLHVFKEPVGYLGLEVKML